MSVEATGSLHRQGAQSPDGAAQAVLERGLSERSGRQVGIVAMRAEPIPTSSHTVERLWVTLDSGEELPVIFKQLHPGEKPYGNEREVLVYRRLLDGGRFGAPLLYASVYDPGAGRYWLFLEDLGERSLKHAGTETWLSAVRWLGRLHGAFQGREDELLALEYLEPHGQHFYHAMAQEACQNLRRAGNLQALQRLANLLRQSARVFAYLDGSRRTLVHGDVFPRNVLLDADGSVRAIDWESAAIGPGEWDLVGLTGGWPESDRRCLVAAYLSEIARLTGEPVDPDTCSRTLLRCEMLNALWYLRWSESVCRDEMTVARLLDEMERAWSSLPEEALHG